MKKHKTFQFEQIQSNDEAHLIRIEIEIFFSLRMENEENERSK